MTEHMWILIGFLTFLSMTLPRTIPSACFDAFIAYAEERTAQDRSEPNIWSVFALAVLTVAATLYLVL